MTDLTLPVPGEETIPPAPVIKRWSKADAGCIIDGVCGWMSGPRMVGIAIECGWTGDEGDDEIIAGAYINNLEDGQWDIWREIQEDVEAWLNDNVAPEGYYFGWRDGDFMLMSEETWCESENLRCTDLDHDHQANSLL